MCEECESLDDRSGQLHVVMGQLIVLSEIKTEVLLENENPSYLYVLWQQYEERIKSLSQESKVSRFCFDTGFVHVVEVGQYFITKDTGYFRQFRSVACREHTLPRDDPASQPKRWIQGNRRSGPVLEVTTSFRSSFWRMTTQHIRIIYCSDLKNELIVTQTDRVSKFFMGAGFIRVVEVGQYVMTRDNGEQFYAKACREKLSQEMMDQHNRKDGFRETRKLDPYWKLRPDTELKS